MSEGRGGRRVCKGRERIEEKMVRVYMYMYVRM